MHRRPFEGRHLVISKDLSRVERLKNLRKELKELRENETEKEWYKIKNGKIVKERIERRYLERKGRKEKMVMRERTKNVHIVLKIRNMEKNKRNRRDDK